MDNFFSKAYADTLYVGLSGGTLEGSIDMGGFNLINADTISATVIDKNGLPVATESFVSSGYQPLDGDLTALAALTGTNTIYYRSAANTWSAVTIGSNLTFSGGTLSASGGGGGDALTANPLSQFAATTSAQLRGVLSDETGTGAAVFAGGNIGAATGTSLGLSGSVSVGAGNSAFYELGSGNLVIRANSGGGAELINVRSSTSTVHLASDAIVGFNSTTDPTSGSTSVNWSRASDGVLQIGTTSNNALGSLNLVNLTASGLVSCGTYTVGTLPTASSNAYKLANVSDSSVTTFGLTVAGGGSSKVMVYSNGTNWTVCAA